MRYRILPYRQGSKSAKALAEELGGKVLKLEGSTFKPKAGDKVINWGSAKPTSEVAPNLLAYGETCSFDDYLNKPSFVIRVSNKLNFFNDMKEKAPDDVPDFWTEKSLVPADAYPVVCRTVLAGHSGAGIVIANSPEDLVDAPLFVRYMKKKDEYRIHVGRRDDAVEVISVQRKARRLDTPDEQVNWQVRNHGNGFVFVRDGVTPPQDVIDRAKRALEVSGLDFGAVDVIWNDKKGRAYVLEINTAPGLEGQTVKDYGDFFRGL